MEIPRRGWLRGMFAALSAAVVAMVGGPVAVAFLDTANRKTVDGGAGSHRIGRLDELPIGVPQRRNIQGVRRDAWDRSDVVPVGAVWLVRRDRKRVDAYSVVCPHLGCPIGYDAARKEFACPCHDSVFALADGSRLQGPAPRGLDPLPVDIRGGDVWISYEKFIQGIPVRRRS